MKQTAYFGEKPDAVTVCVLPTGASDVWLRRNITQKQIADTGDGGVVTQWECEEVYARHGEKLTPESVQERFDENTGPWAKTGRRQPPISQATTSAGGPGGRNGRYAPGREVATMYKFIKMQYQLHRSPRPKSGRWPTRAGLPRPRQKKLPGSHARRRKPNRRVHDATIFNRRRQAHRIAGDLCKAGRQHEPVFRSVAFLRRC